MSPLVRTAATAILATLFACGSLGDPPADESGPDAGQPADPDPDPDPDPAPIVDDDLDGVDDARDNCPGLANAGQIDGDLDGYGDACDCEPANRDIAADLLVVDSLDADRGLLAPATGFAPASWSFSGGTYNQTRLADNAADAAFFALPAAVSDVRIRVVASSTEVNNFGDDDLRQLFVVARANATASTYTALACGAEIVEGLPETRNTSVVAQAGSPTVPTTTPRTRTARAELSEGEEFEILLDLRGGQMTCSVTIAGTTTVATIADAPASLGAVGFFTRETRAAFKDVQVCSYRSSVP